MADKEEGQGTTPRGADWEVVSLAASAYAVAPGATIPKFKLEEKGDVVDKDKVETSNAYSCLVGKVDSSESVGGKLDTKEEENWAFKKLTETDFAENTTLLGINLSGKEQSVYGSSTLQSLHSEATIRELGDIELVRVKLPKKLKKRRQIEIDDGPAGYLRQSSSKTIAGTFSTSTALAFCFFATTEANELELDNPLNLWEKCQGFGTVVDVYIARKLSKLGRRFAFVRFIRVSIVDRLIRRMSDSWYGSYHLYASLARFERKNPKISVFKPGNGIHEGAKIQQEVQQQQSKSYSSFFKLAISTTPNIVIYSNLKPLSLGPNEMTSISDVETTILGKVRDLNLIENIFTVSENYGEVMFVDNEDEGPLCRGRVCIKVKNEGQLNKNMMVKIDEIQYPIWVKEVGTWEPKINSHHDNSKGDYTTSEDPTSDASSDDEKIMEDDILLNDDGLVQEKENEEDIKPAPINVEHEVVNNSEEGEPMPVSNLQNTTDSGPSKSSGFEMFHNATKIDDAERINEVTECSFSSHSAATFGGKKGTHNVISFIEDMSRFIDIGNTLGHDMQGCQISLDKLINNMSDIAPHQ
ncbi:RNA-directed DNA polymerase, eukaryota [Tanacetum coccineum]|uniref:RNA-directed DNA polymerase, eukaryota n=1 Tax=Tanacetum coccineum TaxID=301880 RepID=A0ABQ5B3H4_9ASTR